MKKFCFSHSWVLYTGLQEVFEHCEYCGVKKSDYDAYRDSEASYDLLANGPSSMEWSPQDQIQLPKGHSNKVLIADQIHDVLKNIKEYYEKPDRIIPIPRK